MAAYHNIESRKFPGKDYYTGYGRGCVWRIRKTAQGWRAEGWRVNEVGQLHETGATLADISRKIERHALAVRSE